IMQTSNFAFDDVGSLRNSLQDEYDYYVYSRGNNPTIEILQQKLAALDGAEDAIVFASGVAAVSTPVIANIQAGDHIVCVAKPYSWTNKLFNELLPRFNVTCTMIDGTQIENFERAVQSNTRM